MLEEIVNTGITTMNIINAIEEGIDKSYTIQDKTGSTKLDIDIDLDVKEKHFHFSLDFTKIIDIF